MDLLGNSERTSVTACNRYAGRTRKSGVVNFSTMSMYSTLYLSRTNPIQYNSVGDVRERTESEDYAFLKEVQKYKRDLSNPFVKKVSAKFRVFRFFESSRETTCTNLYHLLR